MARLVNGTPGDKVIGPLAAFPFNGAVTVFGWITLAFFVIDLNVRHLAARAVSSWSPRTLEEPRPEAAKSRLGLLFEIIARTGALGWWLAVPHYPFLVFGPAAALVPIAPALRAACDELVPVLALKCDERGVRLVGDACNSRSVTTGRSPATGGGRSRCG